jgi:hypothetical protein
VYHNGKTLHDGVFIAQSWCRVYLLEEHPLKRRLPLECACLSTCHLSRLPGVQVESVCAIIAGKEEFKDGYNGVGLSQGQPHYIIALVLEPSTGSVLKFHLDPIGRVCS